MATQYEIIGLSEGFPGENKVVTKSISQVTFDTLCFNFSQGSGSDKVSHADLKKCIVTAYLQNAGLVQNLVDNVRLYDIVSYQEHIGGVGVEVGDDSYMIGRLLLILSCLAIHNCMSSCVISTLVPLIALPNWKLSPLVLLMMGNRNHPQVSR